MSKHGISKTLEERSLIHMTKLNNTNRLRSSESTHELSGADLVLSCAELSLIAKDFYMCVVMRDPFGFISPCAMGRHIGHPT
jgi:hypothetical protein